jgi:hypothetical protein
MKNGMKRISVKFPEEMEKAIKARARKDGCTFARVVREACGRMLKIPASDRHGAWKWSPESPSGKTK